MRNSRILLIASILSIFLSFELNTGNAVLAQGNGAYAAYGDLASLPLAKDYVRKRFSSFDRTGGNSDNLKFKPGETKVIAETRSPGCVRHIWCTIGIAGEDGKPEKGYLRKIVIRMFWDGAKTPSVEAPIGDFFGMGHSMSRNFSSAPLQMSPDSGTGFNCWFPMPFAKGMRIEITNECKKGSKIYYYVDWEEYDRPPAGTLRFHASWHREITKGISDKGISQMDFQDKGTNTTGRDNYTILETAGEGQLHDPRDCRRGPLRGLQREYPQPEALLVLGLARRGRRHDLR